MSSPSQRFVSANLKVEWAAVHIKNFESAVAQFLQSKFFSFTIKKEAETGYSVLEFHAHRPPPPELPMLIGDTIHNLRSSLDHLASEVCRGIGDISRVYFPIREKRDELELALQKEEIKKAGQELCALILDEIKPYKDGNYNIWALSRLDNIDKHRLLIPTIAVTSLEGVSARSKNGSIVSNCTFQVGQGGKVSMASTDDSEWTIDNPGIPHFKVMFPKGHFFDDKAIVPTLWNILRNVESAIRAVDGHFAHPARPPTVNGS